MDRQTAIKRLRLLIDQEHEDDNEALRLAITSLSNDDTECKDCYYYKGVIDFGRFVEKDWCKYLDRHVFPDGWACQWFEDKE